MNNNDDDERQSELFRRLAKPEETKTDTQSSTTDDTLLASLGFPNTPNNERGRKRTSDERDDSTMNAKRTNDGTQVTSTGTGSKLCEKNKMLASLLAKQPNNLQQPIPVVPASVLTATPQEKLPRIAPDPNLNKNIPNRMIQGNNMPQQNILNNTRYL